MSLDAPLWLLFLLPWALVALWLLRGYRPTALVPFLHLWPNEPPPPDQRRRRRLPSWPIILLLAAALLAILSGGRPELPIAGRVRPPLIIVDRGITQLAANRYATLIGQATRLLESSCLPEALADVRFVPGPALRIPVRNLSREMLARPAWPLDTRLDLLAAIAQARRDVAAPGEMPILVLSDKSVSTMSGVVCAPSGQPARNVGIEFIAAADTPSPQVMIRLRNDLRQSMAEVTLSSAGRVISKNAKLPPAGESADLFVDLPALGDTVEARLNIQDDLPADNVAYLVREGRIARPVARTVVPPELARMIEVHNRLHAGQAATIEVDISTTPLAPDVCGVLLADVSGVLTGLRLETHGDHPLLRNVTLPQDAILASQAPGEGWTVIASVNSTPLLATRDKPARQVWVGFWSASWARQVDFVIFWTNTFNWLGGEQSGFISESTHSLPAGWEPVSPTNAPAAPVGVWPGLYRHGAVMTAINSPAPADVNATSPATAPAAAASWQDALGQQMSAHPARRELASWLVFAAMLLVLGAAMVQAMRSSHTELSVDEPDITD